MKNVECLLSGIKVVERKGAVVTEVSGVESDSRQVKKDNLFVAVRGASVDGHDFIGQAIAQGAVVVVCEEFPEKSEPQVLYVKVEDSAVAFGLLAAAWYGNPSKELVLVGVTGTNGKTTTATLLYEMFRLFGYKVGLLSTVCNYIDDIAVPATHTTPDPLHLHRLLREMVDAGCAYAFMEVSSHSAAQHRIAGLDFNGAIFTNLTRDHIDYHLLGQEPEEVLRKMSLLVPVAGRFQTLHSSKGYTAIVDYAHTPDALNNVLSSIRDVLGNRGHIITVVGAGGNRDKGKRPMMAREAVNLSDRVILTSDNPRFENPNDILNDMLEGLDAEQRRKTLAIVDRREAIRAATQFAQPGDVVLIAGKGHEDYQEIEGVKHHFDDKEEVEKLFAEERI